MTEWTSLLEYGAFKVVPIEESKGQKLFSALWVLKRKFSGATSAISRLKARLVVRGFEQRPGAHFDESNLYAGVMMFRVRTSSLVPGTIPWVPGVIGTILFVPGV